MTARMIALLAFTAAVLLLVFIAGHHRGRRSCRNEYPDGWDQGQATERQRWEDATGTTWDALARWQSHRAPEPAPAPQWPYAFTRDPALPSAEVLLAEADTVLGLRVPSVAEVDELAAAYEAAHARAPVVADLTGPAAWHYPGEDDVPTMTGVVVTSPQPGPAADWDTLAGRALPGYAAAALGGHRTVDELVDSIVMRAVRP